MGLSLAKKAIFYLKNESTNIRDNNVQYFNLGHVHKPILLLLFFYDCTALLLSLYVAL